MFIVEKIKNAEKYKKKMTSNVTIQIFQVLFPF